MVWRWFLRRQAQAAWVRLSARELDGLPLAANITFTWDGDPDLAVELDSADELRTWLGDRLFVRYPQLRFEVDDIVVCGPPWHVRGATRYRAMEGDQVRYHGIQLTRIRMGKVVEERVVTAASVHRDRTLS